jgi:histidinol phosphatase-like enzyme (inositol monophosphatase family)
VVNPVDMAAVDLGQIDALVGPLVRHAGEIALRHFRVPIVVQDKGGQQGFDPVTEADRSTEAYLRAELAALFPEAEIVGEEGGTSGPASPAPARLCWVIDPIDGTKAYVTGVPAWGVLVGLMIDGRPVAGWCRQPYLDETFAAVAGTGWLAHGGQRRLLGTAPTTDLHQAAMYTTHPSMFVTPAEQAAFGALVPHVRYQRFGGDCYSYCLLALGHIDLVVEANLNPYDIVALIPIVEAAGGVVTGPAGEVPANGGFVIAAATPELHAQALDLVSPYLVPARGERTP